VGLVLADHAVHNFAGGGVGVAVFFVLSGYLITSLLAREHIRSGSVHLRLFYARRALRLWPALLAMLVVTVALGASLRSAAIAGTYLTDIGNVFGRAATPYGHTWSLGVEEQFYLLWPLLLPFALRDRKRASWVLLTAGLLSIFGCWAWTLHSLHATGTIGLGVFNPVWQGHGLIIGCILALVGNSLEVRRPAGVALISGALIVVVAVLASVTVDRHWAVWWNLVTELLAAAAIIALRQGRAGVFASSPVVWMGQRSYAIYLWHLPLITLLASDGVWHATLVALAASFALAELSARFIEAPFLRLKDRMHPPEPGDLGPRASVEPTT
jgi:peptidoglycan/LPS O-acetylase OafA/YrhL